MNFKTMQSYLMLGAKVRHIGWVAKVYLTQDAKGYCLHALDHNMYFENLDRYKGDLYINKYIEGWELYELQNNERVASTGNQNTP